MLLANYVTAHDLFWFKYSILFEIAKVTRTFLNNPFPGSIQQDVDKANHAIILQMWVTEDVVQQSFENQILWLMMDGTTVLAVTSSEIRVV